MRTHVFAACCLITAIATPELAAQSSQFGVRGLGLPGRAASARALGSEGSMGLFDGESSQNPAALGMLTTTTSLFTMTGSWRSSTNPAGGLSARDTRFPQILVGGPIPRRRLAVGVSYSTFADRDFSIATIGLASPRDEPVGVVDTLSSRGGINDLRLAGAWGPTPTLTVGTGIHFLTGSNRLASRRVWEDSAYLSPRETTELSFSAVGLSLGVIWQASQQLELAAAFRRDGKMTIERDSTPTASISLPVTISWGVRFIPTRRIAFSGQVISRNWSVADVELRNEGAIGVRNTSEISAGFEWFRNLRQITRFPLRVGFRTAKLPFLLDEAPQPKEFGFAIGTGARFSGDRGGIDMALQRVRRTQGANYTETAWIFSFGVSVRPGGINP